MKNLSNYIIKHKLKRYTILLSILVITTFTLFNFDFSSLRVGFLRIGNLFSRMYPFDLNIVPTLVKPIRDTVLMAIFSSILGVLTTLLILPLLTTTFFTIKIIPKILSGILSIFRTIPFLIIASVLVSLFSVGNFSGFISLYIISFLMSAKLLKEYAEEINQKYIETYLSTGLNKFQIYKIAVIENLRPTIYAVFFQVLESSIRGASVLGLVGAGGIGQLLWKELNHLRYDRVSLIIIILVIVIAIIDLISRYFRRLTIDKTLTKKSYFIRKNISRVSFIVIVTFCLAYCFKFLDITYERFLIGLGQTKNMLIGVTNPNLAYFEKALVALYDSFIIALVATLMAGLTSIFISYFYAENIVGKRQSLLVKLIINILRTFPPIIVAIIFFRGFGPGYISVFFALYIYTLGITTKMYGEILESIDDNILMSINSMGVKSFSGYINIVFRGYLPEFITILLYRLEMNIKNSTILGMVGAGGIGQLLVNNIEFRKWDTVSVLLIVLLLTIIIVDSLSYYVRKKIKE
ncbi:ABC transporter permease subunit [Gemella sp. GH3]|uniref:PhnE/PtxC family ABC transporter permease n=1 Tax=unclassified Gemella TaxID=2624949 RepID=UPI0015D096BC|nr:MULTISPECIES: ABC transporter permease subunit [unclassified Gemella]MBF0713921.1 ABC transporter permease subunit [Gemella sp. GH3.1]NYS50873.1 ABC transporter permease subunit [Gemella sp. GH3]